MKPAATQNLGSWLSDSQVSWRIPAFLGAFLAMLSFWALRGALTKGDFGIIIATGGLFALGFTFSAKRQRFTHQTLLITALFFLIIHPGFTPGVGFGTLLLYIAILQILQGTDAERTVRNFLTISCIASIYVIRLVRVGMVDFTWVEGGISLSLVLLTLWMIASRSHAWQAERLALIQDLEITQEAVEAPTQEAVFHANRLADVQLLHRCHSEQLTATHRANVFEMLQNRFANGGMTWQRNDQPLAPLESLQAFADIVSRVTDPMEVVWDVQCLRGQSNLTVTLEAPHWATTLKEVAYRKPASPSVQASDAEWGREMLAQAVHALVQLGWATRISGNRLSLEYHVGNPANTNQNASAQQHSRHIYNPGFARKYPMQIMVVEDNPVNQKLVVFMLEKLGYTLTLANDGVEAIEQAEQQVFDLIFMDLHMPRLDGLEASKRILQSQPKLQIVPLTANVSEDSQKACKSAGMIGFIAKPYSIDQLCSAIQRAFEAKG